MQIVMAVALKIRKLITALKSKLRNLCIAAKYIAIDARIVYLNDNNTCAARIVLPGRW